MFFALRVSRVSGLLFSCLFFLCLFLGCESKSKLPYYVAANFTPIWAKPSAAESLHCIAPFSLVNQNGDTVTEKTFTQKIYVANFFFASCPGICPTMTKNLEAVQKAFAGDSGVLLISHTVTPEEDSVPVLKAYAEKHHAVDGQWHFVTGLRDSIYTLARRSYFADEAGYVPDAGGDFLHTEKVFLVDRNRHIRGVYSGALPTEMLRLIDDIRSLRKAQ